MTGWMFDAMAAVCWTASGALLMWALMRRAPQPGRPTDLERPAIHVEADGNEVRLTLAHAVFWFSPEQARDVAESFRYFADVADESPRLRLVEWKEMP